MARSHGSGLWSGRINFQAAAEVEDCEMKFKIHNHDQGIDKIREFVAEMRDKYQMTANELRGELTAGRIYETMEHIEYLMCDEILKRFDAGEKEF